MWKYVVVATLIVLLGFWATHLFVIFDTRLPCHTARTKWRGITDVQT